MQKACLGLSFSFESLPDIYNLNLSAYVSVETQKPPAVSLLFFINNVGRCVSSVGEKVLCVTVSQDMTFPASVFFQSLMDFIYKT